VTPATGRAPRREAQRNRERILAAEREVVAQHGVAAAMDHVAAGAATARICAGTAETAGLWAHRFLGLHLDGLRPGGDPLPGRPLTERRLVLTLDAPAHSRRGAAGDA
jgi:hypothetical protein